MGKLDKFLIIIIIINLFATIYILFAKEKKEEYKVFEIGNFEEFLTVYKVGPSPERYRKYIQNMVEEDFKKLYEETKYLSDTELKQYYDEKNVIEEVATISYMKSIYGISDYETFDKIVKKLCDIYDSGAVYKKSSIVKKSCKVEKNYTTSEIVLYYSKYKKLHLKVEMSNLVNSDVQMFKITVKEDK